MQFMLDKTGYPYLRLPGTRLGIGLLPVTKYQIESWISEPGAKDDAWYKSMLAVRPRISRRYLKDSDSILDAFIAGVNAEEAQQFSKWLGRRFRILTEAEWKTAYRKLRGISPFLSVPEGISPEARVLWSRLSESAAALPEAMLMSSGYAEWVALSGGGYGLLGRPRDTLWPSGAEGDEPLTPHEPITRDPRYGMRLALEDVVEL